MLVVALFAGCSEHPNEEMGDTLIVGTSPDNPPFEFYETDSAKKLTGFDIELIRNVAQKMKKKIVFKEMEFSSLIPALISGRIHVIASAVTKTPDRERHVAFTDTYKTSSPVIVLDKHIKKSAQVSLANRRLAAQLGSTHEETLKLLGREHNNEITIVPVNKLTEMLQELQNNRIDGFLTEYDNALKITAKYPEWSYIVLTKHSESYSFALRHGNPLRDEINDALAEMRTNGQLTKLAKKWFSTQKPASTEGASQPN